MFLGLAGGRLLPGTWQKVRPILAAAAATDAEAATGAAVATEAAATTAAAVTAAANTQAVTWPCMRAAVCSGTASMQLWGPKATTSLVLDQVAITTHMSYA